MERSLIYFERTVVAANGMSIAEIAVVEGEESATRYEAQGFRRCSYAEFRAAWRARDMMDFQRQWAALGPEALRLGQVVMNQGLLARTYSE
jgi:hypothetical protein